VGSDLQAVLRRISAEDFTGAAELRRQVDYPDECEKSAAAPGPIPVRALVTDRSGELEGEILSWTEEGRLSALEFAWYGSEMPRSLPRVERITIQ